MRPKWDVATTSHAGWETSNLNFNVQLFWKSENHLFWFFKSQLHCRNENQNLISNFSIYQKNEMALWVHGFFTYCPVNHEYSWKKIQIEKKSEFCFRTCKNRLSVCDGWRASWLFQWRRSLSYRNQTIDFENKSVDWFLYDRGIRHDRVHPLLLTFIHQDILLDYDKLCIWHLRI